MDDPWGSPWANNDSNTSLDHLPRHPTSAAALELPGRTLTRDRSFSSVAPWAIDEEEKHDAFGSWLAADTGLSLPPTAATSTAGWSAWGGENGLNSSQTHLSSTSREASLALPGPLAWPAPTSPGLSQSKTLSRRSSARSLFRQPSPDPWATEVSQNRLSLPSAVHISAEQTAFSSLARHDEEATEENFGGSAGNDSNPSGQGIEAGSVTSKSLPPENGALEPEQTTGLDEESHGGEHGGENHSHSPTGSRHSSQSVDSHRDDQLDSPITSMDEESKDRPPMQRRRSSKVQQLVDKYDDMGKKKDDKLLAPMTTGGRQRSASRSTSIRSLKTDDGSDFGDFEDGQGFASGPSSRQPSISGSPRPSNPKAGRLRSLSKPSLRRANSTAPDVPAPSPIPEEASNRFQELRVKFGTIEFAPDLGTVDQLFDVAKLDKEQPAAKDYSLDAIDGIIKDSFTSVSERKMWYRISRPGPMRKHDTGDDDNYRRVTWTTSTVRQDTAKIVRRWMEQDSYPGQPTVGGGNGTKSGGFNWDSKVERQPLSFDQIFGKRKSVQPTKAASLQVPRPLSLQPQPTGSTHSRQSSASIKSLPPRSPLSIPAPQASPGFGWSTGANDSATPASPRPSSQHVRQSLDVGSYKSTPSRPASIQEPESRSSLQLPQPTSLAWNKSKDPVQALKDDDDEDEWGDMIESPATDSRPVSMLFDDGTNVPQTGLPASKSGSVGAVSDTGSALDAVSTSLRGEESVGSAVPETTCAANAAPVDIWDFSAFDHKSAAPALPPTATSKPEFDFETPLQSPTYTASSRSGSPAAFPSPNPPTPPVRFQPQPAPRSSLSLNRPSPLHNVITPKPASPEPINKTTQPPKAVSFAQENEEDVAVRRIIGRLPDLSYMLR